METSVLTSLILFEDNQSLVIDKIRRIQEQLKQFSHLGIRSRYEILLFEWLMLTVERIPWNMAIQLQELIEGLGSPVIFVGPRLNDLGLLKNGTFDTYFRDLLGDTDKLEEFIMYFLPFTPILDYCLVLWNEIISKVNDLEELEELKSRITYSPLISIINEQRLNLDPNADWKQRSLDDYF